MQCCCCLSLWRPMSIGSRHVDLFIDAAVLLLWNCQFFCCFLFVCLFVCFFGGGTNSLLSTSMAMSLPGVTCVRVRQATTRTLQDCVKVSVTCMGVRQASTRTSSGLYQGEASTITLQDCVKVSFTCVRGRLVYSWFLHSCVKVRVWNMCETGLLGCVKVRWYMLLSW